MRKALALLLAVGLALSAAGCSTFFDREYYASEEYQAQEQETEEEDDAISSISSYAALKRAITSLVEEHVESAQLQFLNYEGTIST
ncbi:MAG: hypothetical protein LUH36_07765, partial [Oscillospiraceae bacterium]|nr:hypothetical protein [Oscillospiraceae bacterium]